MQQEHFERSFSRGKHAAGAWRTSVVPSSRKPVRWCVARLSFKYRELDDLARRCHPFSMVLDFGCGNGAYAGFFCAGSGATVIAVDWSPEALHSIAPPKRGSLLAVCADLHALPFKASSFDALYSIDTLGHLSSHERALDEINRVCRGGAPLFLHSECADYRLRTPDRPLIAKTGCDPIAAIDGHDTIRPSHEMRTRYERRFTLGRFYSPAGMFGWLFGYPEKYYAPLLKARMYGFAAASGAAALLKKIPGISVLFRIVNMATNRLELLLGIEGGGSCFAQARCVVPTASGDACAIDIVIASWRREASLRQAVGSIIGQCRSDDRIYIVHQGRDKQPVFNDRRIGVLRQPVPNLPAARNSGSAAGGNPIVLFIDDDCIAGSELLDGHRRIYSDEDIGAAAGFVEDTIFPEGAQSPSWFDVTTGELRQHFALPESDASISVMGANMSFRRRALESIGGFDPQYCRNALWEEIDVAFRIQNAGYRIRFAADARVKHCRVSDGGCRADSRSAQMFHTFANTAYFAGTYAPREHLRTWLRFWMYRLEYLSRRPVTGGRPEKLRHDPRLAASGLAGVIFGCIRCFIFGNRRKLPGAVIDHYRQTVSRT